MMIPSRFRATPRLAAVLLLGTASAFRNNRSENVRVHAIIVAELELGNIERQIFLADFVEGSDHATFDDRPETFNSLRVDRTDHVLLFGVIDDGVRIFLAEML